MGSREAQKKEAYDELDMEVIVLDGEDVIYTSPCPDDEGYTGCV